MSDINDVLYDTLKDYAREGLNGIDYFTMNEAHNFFVIAGMGNTMGKRFADAGIIVRVASDFVVIESDYFDPPLVNSLLQAGIPRDKIILAYQGEEVPPELEVIPQAKPSPNPADAKLAFTDGRLTIEKSTR